MPDLDMIMMGTKVAALAAGTAAVATVALYPICLAAQAYVSGVTHQDGLRDGKSGLKFFWKVASEVPISDVYRLLKNGPEEFDKKYQERFQDYFLKPEEMK